MEHKITIIKEFADAVLSGDKTFDVRENDKGYQRGDTVRFEVYDYLGYTQSWDTRHPITKKRYIITYVLSGWGISEGYVVFGIKPLEEE